MKYETMRRVMLLLIVLSLASVFGFVIYIGTRPVSEQREMAIKAMEQDLVSAECGDLVHVSGKWYVILTAQSDHFVLKSFYGHELNCSLRTLSVGADKFVRQRDLLEYEHACVSLVRQIAHTDTGTNNAH